MTEHRPFVPPAVRSLDPFVDAGVLGPTDVHTAEMIARVTDDPTDELVLATALAMRAPQLGHVCLSLREARRLTIAEAPDAELDDLAWPDPQAWIDRLAASDVVRTAQGGASGTTTAPLVLDGDHLYLDRYWNYEQRVIDEIVRRSRLQADVTGDDDELLDRLFGQATEGDGADHQRRAASRALTHGFSVIAGGPGTGKTYTVARLLAAFHGRATEATPTQVALAAPTGKAAARMTEAIREAADSLDLERAVLDELRTAEASTLHRLLGSTWGNRFRHNRSNPLPHDVVVVDETSMVSLPLMYRLLDAVRPDATIVLVGDPYQLRSIEAGTVLGDIVGLGGRIDPEQPLASGVTTLERVHRFAAESPIAALADAVRTGDAQTALALLDIVSAPPSSGSDEGMAGIESVVRIDPSDVEAVRAVEERAAAQAGAVIAAADEGDGRRALDHASSRKLLCATRHGPGSVTEWTERIEARLHDNTTMRARPGGWYSGRAVMIRRNDYATGVFNGDVGVMADIDGKAQVVIEGPDGLRFLEPAQLDEVDTWWAMTIHKSQGSEFDEIVISLPPTSALLTRELLYTAITRARTRVTIVATEATLRAAIDQPITRTSGLRRALWGDAASATAKPPAEDEQVEGEPDDPATAKKVRRRPNEPDADDGQLSLFSQTDTN